MFFIRVIKSLEAKKIQYAVVGGWAVALHGAVRGTVDLDIVVSLTEKNMKQAVKALNAIGLESRLPLSAKDVIQFRQEYIQKKNMLAWRFMNPSNPAEIVDVLIVEDLRKLKTTFIKLASGKVPVVTIDELIRMKKKSARPQDLEDIKALELIKK